MELGIESAVEWRQCGQGWSIGERSIREAIEQALTGKLVLAFGVAHKLAEREFGLRHAILPLFDEYGYGTQRARQRAEDWLEKLKVTERQRACLLTLVRTGDARGSENRGQVNPVRDQSCLDSPGRWEDIL